MDVSPETGQFKTKRIQYSREELIELQNSPQSNYRPKELDPEFYSTTTGKWDPVEWHRSFSRSRTPIDEDRKDSAAATKRRHFDAKERVKDEHEKSIVLSPQRSSFFSGCHVNASSIDRDLKRLGNARLSKEGIQRRHWDERNEKRGGWRGRHHRSEVEETPEWFSEGPTSQYDTIELRGLYEGETTNQEKEKKPVEKGPKIERKNPDASYPTERRTSPDGRASGDFDINDFLRQDFPDLLPSETPSHGSRFFSSYGVQEDQDGAPSQENGGFIPEAARECHQSTTREESIVEMLQKAGDKDRLTPDELFQTGPHCIKALAREGKAKNLSEVEAGLHLGSDGDMSAFKKLLAHVNTGSLIPAAQLQRESRSMGTTPLRNSPQPQPIRSTKDDMHAGYGGMMQHEQRMSLMQPPPPAIVESFANIRYAQPPQHHRPQPRVVEAHLHEAAYAEKKARREEHVKLIDSLLITKLQAARSPTDARFLQMMRQTLYAISNRDLVRSSKELEALVLLLQNYNHAGRITDPDIWFRKLAAICQSSLQHQMMHQVPDALHQYKSQMEDQARMSMPSPHFQNKSGSLAFTPTAVMRKMTTEKGIDDMVEMASDGLNQDDNDGNMVRQLFENMSIGNLPQLPQALSVDELEKVNL